ncbi:hypothetical protein QL285_014218 [Trifolium repens]|nr:hypothetical protein QL285_014218 [Trifolium repens]
MVDPASVGGLKVSLFRFGLVKVVVAALVAVFALAVGGVCNQMFFFGVWFVRVCVQRLGFVAEVEDGGSGDGGVWVQIEVEVVGGMLWFGVAGVDLASSGSGFGDDCGGEEVVVGGDEVSVSWLTSSASASTDLSSVVICFFGVVFATTSLMVVPQSLSRLVCLVFRSTFVWSAICLMKLVLDSDGPSAFASSSGVSV